MGELTKDMSVQMVKPDVTSSELIPLLKDLENRGNKFITKFPEYTYDLSYNTMLGEKMNNQDCYIVTFVVRKKNQEELNRDHGTY